MAPDGMKLSISMPLGIKLRGSIGTFSVYSVYSFLLSFPLLPSRKARAVLLSDLGPELKMIALM